MLAVPWALKSPKLARILVSYTINRLGTWVGLLALLVSVFDHTHSALALSALLFAGQALPALVGPALVARVEASKRRSELTALYLFEAVVTVGLAVLLGNFSLAAILVLVALDGTASLAASALLRAEVARAAREEAEALAGDGHVAEQERLAPGVDRSDRAIEAERKGNAAMNVAFSVSFLIGPLLGGVVVAAAGPATALLIDAGSFLVAGALVLDLHPHVEEAAGDSVRARLRAAWTHIEETPMLRAVLLVEAVAIVFLEAVGPIEVGYAKATLNAGDRGLGLLLATWGAGTVVGSVAFARLGRRPLGLTLSFGTFAVGLAYLGYTLAPTLLVACLAAVLGGVGNGIELPSLNSIVQQLTPKRLHGRLMGAVESMTALCLAIGLPLGGLLVAISSARAAFLIIGLATVAAATALFAVTRGLRLVSSGEEPALAAGGDGQILRSDIPATD